MAIIDEQVAGTVALRKIGDEVFEFTKMAVDRATEERHRRALSHESYGKRGKQVAQGHLYSNTENAAASNV